MALKQYIDFNSLFCTECEQFPDIVYISAIFSGELGENVVHLRCAKKHKWIIPFKFIGEIYVPLSALNVPCKYNKRETANPLYFIYFSGFLNGNVENGHSISLDVEGTYIGRAVSEPSSRTTTDMDSRTFSTINADEWHGYNFRRLIDGREIAIFHGTEGNEE